MGATWSIRGREVRGSDLEQIGSWIGAHPEWSRRRLSLELARQWDWRTATGQLKDIAVRDILNRLAAWGLISLPPRQRRGGRQRVRAWVADQERFWPVGPVAGSEPQPLSWHQARSGERQRALIAHYLREYHYLGYPDPLGQIHYLARDPAGRPVACLLFGPACWRVAARDQWIGWSDLQRQCGLGLVANNSRFVLLPWAQRQHRASQVLAQAIQQLRADWPAVQGRPLWLVETFVEAAHFLGTCYRAANWLKIGQTQGRTRNDRWHCCQVPRKDVYVLPLLADFQQRFCSLSIAAASTTKPKTP